MKARIATSVLLAVGVLLGTSACNLFVPQSTTESYMPSDGADVTVGELAIRNAVLVTADGTSANLVVTVVSRASKAETLNVELQTPSQSFSKTVLLEPGSVNVFTGPGSQEITFSKAEVQPGALSPVYFQYGDVEGQSILVPVLTDEEYYASMAPTPTPSALPSSKPAPLPTPTPEPTPES